jgi:hypothetical protein
MTTHAMHARPTLAARIRAWLYRPTRAQLIADRAAAQARTAELEAQVAELRPIADQWDAFLDAADEFDREHEQLLAVHEMQRADWISALIEDVAKDEAIERLEALYVERAELCEAARDEAWIWETAYSEAFVSLPSGELATVTALDRDPARVVRREMRSATRGGRVTA